MKRIILLALIALFALPALADAVYKDESITVRLSDKPCVDPVAALIRDELVPQSKAGLLEYQGRTIRLCWAVLRPGVVTIVDEDGDGGILPMEAFKEAPGV